VEDGDEDDAELVEKVRHRCTLSDATKQYLHNVYSAVTNTLHRTVYLGNREGQGVGRLEGQQPQGLGQQDGQALLRPRADREYVSYVEMCSRR
jgi:hypothetical protein